MANLTLISLAPIFVPELRPLMSQIIKAIGTVNKLETVLAPALVRIEQGEVAVLELAEAAPALNELMPDVTAAVATFAKVRAIVAKYEAAIDAQMAAPPK